MAEKPDRIILWTLPYYVDYTSYNSAKMGEYDTEDIIESSCDSAFRFVQYITRLRLQWVTSIPTITFYPLNQVLFNGQNYSKMFKTFGAASGEHFRFPNNLLTDGLHQNAKLVRLMWFGLHQAVNRVNQHTTILSTDALDQAGPSTKKRKEVTAPRGPAKVLKVQGSKINKKRILNRYPSCQTFKKSASSVHSRLDYRGDDTAEEELEDPADYAYGNISWRASDSNLSEASTSRSMPLRKVKNSVSDEPWSWDYHHRVVRETRSKCYTQGIREQAMAEARLSSMIRQHGLRAAGQGMINSFNQAKLKWSSNAMEKINDPEKRIRLVQQDLTNLLTDEDDDYDEDEEEDEEEEDSD
ncbi:unnamed protein product [Rotaria magnacalcarata]|uniref:Uncharacterized protein n=1 Tax=Rotaria magnacalcarata TaxID=392030 RepID=A0A816ZZ62_9BILA|nr:unnamed protein product [Rotaria magnacalcarata]